MSQMLPEGGEVMRRVACADVCPAPLAPASPPHCPGESSPPENKELLRQQLLAAGAAPRAKHARSRQKNRWKLKFHHQALPQEYLDHYEQSLQRAGTAPRRPDPAPAPRRAPRASATTAAPAPAPLDSFASEAFDVWAHRLAAVSGDGAPQQPCKGARAEPERRRRQPPAPAPAPAKVVTYEDLPYMGEITLNHAKPRRGRKPKKADICHLIYENYGTVVPGQPQEPPTARPPSAPADAARSDLQNRIISNLLERKLTQERRHRAVAHPGPGPPDDEPLNLCIRDLRELRIQIQRRFGDAHAPSAAETEQPNAISVIQRNTNLAASDASPPAETPPRASPALSEPARPTEGDGATALAGGYMYWPSAGVYMHPLALQTQLLYYQRLAAAARHSPERESAASTPTGSPVEAPSPDDAGAKIVLKQISELLDPRLVARPEGPERSPERGGTKRCSPQPPGRGPAKRKRSAIFIPPVPARSSSTTPTAEVSICKFKFTGGSKPSLQEKKMLSVDAGGNFRYYSGASGKGKGAEARLREVAPAALAPAPLPPAAAPAPPEDCDPKKKRKSRKSLQREKLERTFKEKGFLIQTQQLQSAEGATYCKFRQLRKFTRYLFRSWKDYLPGELHERAPEALGPPPPPAPAPDWP